MEKILSYNVIRTDRMTIVIQIKPDGTVIVRCPKRMAMAEVRRFVESKSAWIEKHLEKCSSQRQEKYTEPELKALREQARVLVTQSVQHYAPLVGVSYKQITIRTQHTRWGSCSSKGNLNFNCLLALVPREVLDYVVVHELCHRKEMNHSDRFWNEVARIIPDYKSRKQWLKDHGAILIARI